MTDPIDLATPLTEKPRRQPSAAALWLRKSRELRVVDALERGASLAAMAQREGVTSRRMRDIVNALLATHQGLEPADGRTQMRERRLDQALDAAVSEMRSGSRTAIDQLIRLLREFDRNAEIGHLSRTEKRAKSEA